jgi:hypothetical protein
MNSPAWGKEENKKGENKLESLTNSDDVVVPLKLYLCTFSFGGSGV